jgi:xanthine dehydrogenase YagS FAD-binding subunit
MKGGIRTPQQLVHIAKLPEMTSVAASGDELVIGALVTVAQLESDPVVGSQLPLLRQAAGEVATPQLRQMGTAVGNILQRPRCWYYRDPDSHCLRKGGQRCHAVVGDNRYHAILGGGPCHIVCPSDLAPALMALGASVTIHSKSGDRTMALEEFFVGPDVDPHNENILGLEEIVTAIRVPVPKAKTTGVFLKVRERKVWDFALASVALQVSWAGDQVKKASIVLGGVAPNPWVAAAAADSLAGQALTEESCGNAADLAVKDARPLRHNAYKVELTRNLVLRALQSLS